MYGTTDAFYTQRYAAFELNKNLDIIRSFESPLIFRPGKGFNSIAFTSDGSLGPLFDACVYNDTIFMYGRYLMVDSPSVMLGNTQYYFKAHFNGTIYEDAEMPYDWAYNCFFKENNLYVQGSCFDPTDVERPKAVGWYNYRGDWIKGWDFDNSTSGEFPWGACGGFIGKRLFFSYLGRDPNLSGCPSLNVAIDVRDFDFKPLHRFKISQCDYLYSGKMPFAMARDGSIYFRAVHKSYKKFILQKYGRDMELIWSREFEVDNDFFTVPFEMVPSADGGVLMGCYQELNNVRRVHLYKFSPNGDPVVSAQEAAYEPLRAEPSV
ncbi:MAG: hypothetical protein NZM43_13715, partial [Saprospiraceae bacterium]|nr:hypothetical protein [Saprospiraceae bacterium]MDW8485372.1 hypothetical protein [Saprospiraceae bacterium]